MSKSSEFYTLKGYQMCEHNELTPAMEDYLEMICRILCETTVVRIGELAFRLNVKPSSASKMIRQLTSAGYVNSEKYGYVTLTEKGRASGAYLMYRHEVLMRFLRLLNGSDDVLDQVEKIEHFIDETTIDNLYSLCSKLESDLKFKKNSESS